MIISSSSPDPPFEPPFPLDPFEPPFPLEPLDPLDQNRSLIHC